MCQAVRAVDPGGWDNRTFRLGADLLVRLPSRARYVAQVAKEQMAARPRAIASTADSLTHRHGQASRGLPMALVGLPLAGR